MNIASLESRYHDMEMHPTLGGFDLYLADPDTRTDRVFELDWKPDLGPDPESALMTGEQTSSLFPVGSSVNLAGFSSTSTGWKAQLVYSLATLFFAASLLWFSTPSRRTHYFLRYVVTALSFRGLNRAWKNRRYSGS